MTLGHTNRCWISSFKYLCINFLSDLSPEVDISLIKHAFYISCNGILSYCKSNVDAKLSPVKVYCLPLLTYYISTFVLCDTSVLPQLHKYTSTCRDLWGIV